jgi:hypothetical protein
MELIYISSDLLFQYLVFNTLFVLMSQIVTSKQFMNISIIAIFFIAPNKYKFYLCLKTSCKTT